PLLTNLEMSSLAAPTQAQTIVDAVCTMKRDVVAELVRRLQGATDARAAVMYCEALMCGRHLTTTESTQVATVSLGPDVRVRASALKVLARHGDEGVGRAAALAAVKDMDVRVKVEALALLSKVGVREK